MKGKIVEDPVEITNNFNNFFANVGPDTEKTVPKVPNMSPTMYLKNRNQFDLIVAHISEDVATVKDCCGFNCCSVMQNY